MKHKFCVYMFNNNKYEVNAEYFFEGEKWITFRIGEFGDSEDVATFPIDNVLGVIREDHLGKVTVYYEKSLLHSDVPGEG